MVASDEARISASCRLVQARPSARKSIHAGALRRHTASLGRPARNPSFPTDPRIHCASLYGESPVLIAQASRHTKALAIRTWKQRLTLICVTRSAHRDPALKSPRLTFPFRVQRGVAGMAQVIELHRQQRTRESSYEQTCEVMHTLASLNPLPRGAITVANDAPVIKFLDKPRLARHSVVPGTFNHLAISATNRRPGSKGLSSNRCQPIPVMPPPEHREPSGGLVKLPDFDGQSVPQRC